MKIYIYILLCYFSTQLFASYDLALLYKKEGIASVQKELDKNFETKEFWDQYLKNIDTTYGYYESIDFTLVCKPDIKIINVFKNTQNEKQKIFQSYVMTGKNNGPKNEQGDLRTPIGVYTLVEKLKNVDPFYGPLALVTNYPNNFDKIYGRTGNGIWIHGVPENAQRDPYTKGCIALDNLNLEALDKNIVYQNSVLIIENENQELNSSNKSDIATILANIYQWKNSWESGNFDKYITFYSENFKKTDGSDFEQFKSYKKSIFDKNEKKEIIFKDINITPYPNEENRDLYKIKYYQVYSTKSVHFSGEKELYIEFKDQKISILFEG